MFNSNPCRRGWHSHLTISIYCMLIKWLIFQLRLLQGYVGFLTTHFLSTAAPSEALKGQSSAGLSLVAASIPYHPWNYFGYTLKQRYAQTSAHFLFPVLSLLFSSPLHGAQGWQLPLHPPHNPSHCCWPCFPPAPAVNSALFSSELFSPDQVTLNLHLHRWLVSAEYEHAAASREGLGPEESSFAKLWHCQET